MNIYEILDEIEQAYPEDIFPPTTEDERKSVMEQFPGFIDRTSAAMGRHLTKVIRRRLAEREEGRLRKTAQNLLDYYDQYGAREFHYHFGDEHFVKFLREFMTEGEAEEHSDSV